MLKPTQVVALYYDPLTRTKLQCNAILVEKCPDNEQVMNDNIEVWMVTNCILGHESKAYSAMVNVVDAPDYCVLKK